MGFLLGLGVVTLALMALLSIVAVVVLCLCYKPKLLLWLAGGTLVMLIPAFMFVAVVLVVTR